MSEQLLNLAISCIVWMVNTFLKYLLISGAILKTIFCQVKELSEKDWLNLSNRQFLLSFLWDQGIVSVEVIL